MARAKVFNDNIYPYNETFKGEKISIPVKGFIEMDYDEAIEFRGAFSSIERDATGTPKPSSYKMIRVEKIGGDDAAIVDTNKCVACGKAFAGQGELANHIFEQHPESMAPESREEAISALNKMKSKR